MQMAVCGLRTWYELLVFLFPSHFLFLFLCSTVSGLENCVCLSSLSALIFFPQKHRGLIDQLCLPFKLLSAWLGSSFSVISVSHLDMYFSELMTYIRSQIGYLYFMSFFHEKLKGTYSFTPGETCGMMFFDICLKLRPDVQVGLHPINMACITVKNRNNIYICVCNSN